MSKSFFAVSASVFSLIISSSPALSQSVVLSAKTGSALDSASAGWGPSSVSFDDVYCVGCGIPGVPNTYYGAGLGLTTSGSVGVNSHASASTGAITVNTNSNAALNIAKDAASGNYKISYAPNTAALSFTQSGASLSVGIGASIKFDASLSGRVCVVECASFGTSLPSADTSFTVLGANTAGTGSVTALGISVPGMDGKTQTFKSGATNIGIVSLKAPGDLQGQGLAGVVGAFGDVRSDVLSGSLNLTNIGTALANLPSLNGSYGYGSLSVGYNLLTASLSLTAGLYQSTFITDLYSTTPFVEFFDRTGTQKAETLSIVDGEGTLVSVSASGAYLTTASPLILESNSLAKGDYAQLISPYSLSIDQTASVFYNASLDITALGVSYRGNQYNAISQNYPLFSETQQLLNIHTGYDGAVTNDFSLPAPAPGVPEPAAWGMLVTGFGVAGMALRRRRFVVAAA